MKTLSSYRTSRRLGLVAGVLLGILILLCLNTTGACTGMAPPHSGPPVTGVVFQSGPTDDAQDRFSDIDTGRSAANPPSTGIQTEPPTFSGETDDSVSPPSPQDVVEGLQAILSRRAPLTASVDVQFADLGDVYWGLTRWDPVLRTFIIQISYKAGWMQAMDTLVHEWAHCMAWDVGGSFRAHSAVWGVCYAKAYRIATGEDRWFWPFHARH